VDGTARVAQYQSVEELIGYFRELGFPYLCWQMRSNTFLQTWDAMPQGFLEHYYGTQMDQPCAVAEAIRRHWQNFTFSEAREAFGQRPGASGTESVWRAFGINDGIVIFSGRGWHRSTTALCGPADADPIIQRHGADLVSACWRLHHLLDGHPGLIQIPRALIELTEKQIEVLLVQIENPHMTLAEQAAKLGISPRMIEKRHRQIAERFGVSSFAGAVAIAARG